MHYTEVYYARYEMSQGRCVVTKSVCKDLFLFANL